jgi:hypothetical protein
LRRRNHQRWSPLLRWLAAQCGRPWDKIYGELCERYDRRTRSGRELLRQTRDVVRRSGVQYGAGHNRFGFVIDRHGILRRPR